MDPVSWWTDRRPEERRLLVWATVGFAIVAACGLVVAKLLDDVMDDEDAAQLDPRVLAWVADRRTSWATTGMRAATFLGDGWVVAAVVVAALVGFWAVGRPRLGLLVVASSAGTALLVGAMKTVVDRPRPPAAQALASFRSPAFPSGHAAQSIACYGAVVVALALAVGVRRWWVTPLATGAIALAIGGSRVYLAVHWPSDVVAGWAAATAWLTVLLVAGGPGRRWWAARAPA